MCKYREKGKERERFCTLSMKYDVFLINKNCKYLRKGSRHGIINESIQWIHILMPNYNKFLHHFVSEFCTSKFRPKILKTTLPLKKVCFLQPVLESVSWKISLIPWWSHILETLSRSHALLSCRSFYFAYSGDILNPTSSFV